MTTPEQAALAHVAALNSGEHCHVKRVGEAFAAGAKWQLEAILADLREQAKLFSCGHTREREAIQMALSHIAAKFTEPMP